MANYPVTTANVQYRAAGFSYPTYDGGAAPANQGAILDYHKGKGTAPLRGRPVLVRMVGGGYTSSQKPGATLDSTSTADYRIALCALWADMGGSVIEAAGLVSDTTAPYTKFVANGKTTSGLLIPPAFTPSGAGFQPYGHVDTPNWNSDNVHLIQHVKDNIDAYEGDPENIWTLGDSMSSHGFLWACLKERASELGAGNSQLRQSTRVRGMFADRPGIVRWHAYDQTLAVPVCPANASLAGGDYTTPMATMADFPTAAGVGMDFKSALSLLGTGGFGNAALIAGTAMFLSTGMAGAGDSTASNTILDPADFAGLTATEPLHSSWFPSVLKAQVTGAPCEFWCGTDAAKNSVANEDGAYGIDAATSGQRTIAYLALAVAFARKHAFTSPALLHRPTHKATRFRPNRLRVRVDA